MMSLTDRIHKATRLNNEILTTLNETVHDWTTYPLAFQLAIDLRNEIVPIAEILPVKHELTDREHEQLRALDQSKIRKSFAKLTGTTDSFTKKKDEEEIRFQRAWQEEEDLKIRQSQLEHQAMQVETERDRCEQGYRIHSQKQAELNDLYTDIFDSRTFQFPEHDELNRELSKVSGNCAQVAETEHRFARAVKCLQDAAKWLNQARIDMCDAKRMSDWDTWVGGTRSSMLKRQDMDKSQRSIMTAERCIFEASTLVPGIQLMHDLDVGAPGSGWADVIFDNIITNIKVGKTIAGNMDSIQTEIEQNDQQLRNTIERLQTVRQQLNDILGRKSNLQWNLQRMRMDIFNMVGNNGAGPVFSPPPLMSNKGQSYQSPNYQPRAAYSAPPLYDAKSAMTSTTPAQCDIGPPQSSIQSPPAPSSLKPKGSRIFGFRTAFSQHVTAPAMVTQMTIH